jgi:hypothetical protein
MIECSQGLLQSLAAAGDSQRASAHNRAQDLEPGSQPGSPRTYNWDPGEAGKGLAIILDSLGDLSEAWTEAELLRKLGKERLDELLGSTEHPWVEVQQECVPPFELGASEVNKRSLPGAPGAHYAHDYTLRCIKGKNFLRERSGGGRPTERVLAFAPDRVVGSDGNAAPAGLRESRPGFGGHALRTYDLG